MASNVSKHLAIATATPFDPRAKGAVLPGGESCASYTSSCKVVVDSVLGSDGTAFVAVNPSAFNNCAAVWFTSGGVSNTTLNTRNYIIDYASFGVSGAQAQGTRIYENTAVMELMATSLPFSSGDALTPVNNGEPCGAPQVRARVVSAGVRVSFSGNTLTDGGMIYGMVEPNLNSLQYFQLNDLNQYTCLKQQRVGTRGVVELCVHPVTVESTRMGQYWDSIFTSNGNGLAINGGQVCAPYFSIPNTIYRYTIPNSDFQATGLVDTDATMQAERVMQTLYPLSRSNGDTYSMTSIKKVPANGTEAIAHLFGFDVATSGLITQAAGYPSLTRAMVGQRFVWASVGSGSFSIYFDDVNNAYRITNSDGGSYTGGAITGGTARMAALQCAPPILGGIFLNCGTAAAGQTYHIEYVVHVEYSGWAVQGRTNPVTPDVQGMANVHAIANHAREANAQCEHHAAGASFAHAAGEVIAAEAPGVAAALTSVIAPELAPMAASAVQYGIGLMKKRRWL